MTGVLEADEMTRRRYYLFRPCETMEELHDWIVAFLAIDYPDAIVDPDSNSSPMRMIWEVYDRFRRPDVNEEGRYRYMVYAARSSYKTLAASTLAILLVLHLRSDVALMAAIEKQTSKPVSYAKKAFRRSWISDFVSGNNKRTIDIVRFYDPETGISITEREHEELKASNSAAALRYVEDTRYLKIIVCTLAGTNSDHCAALICDEIDTIKDVTAFNEAKSIPQAQGHLTPLEFYTSTRKRAGGLVQHEIDEGEKDGLRVLHWNIIDVTEACPVSRHRPDLPRLPIYRSNELLHHLDAEGFAALSPKEQASYVEDSDVYAGCAKCRLYPLCRGNLATKQTGKSPLLMKIKDSIGAMRGKTLDHIRSQLKCDKPSTSGLVYPRFSRGRHLISPANVYERLFGEQPSEKDGGALMTKAKLTEAVQARGLEWWGGMDFGDTHNFACVVGFADGHVGYVMRVLGGPGLEPDRQIAECEPIKHLRPSIWPDTSMPGVIRMFRRNGYVMKSWPKKGGTVADGIEITKMKMNPSGSDAPHLLFVYEPGGDREMDIMIKTFEEYSWEKGADGQPTGKPEKKGDDFADALRYGVMNKWPQLPAGVTMSYDSLVTPDAGTEPVMTAQSILGDEYAQQDFARQVFAGVIPRVPRTMTVETPDGSGGYRSYYDDAGATPSQKERPARDPGTPGGGIIWDF